MNTCCRRPGRRRGSGAAGEGGMLLTRRPGTAPTQPATADPNKHYNTPADCNKCFLSEMTCIEEFAYLRRQAAVRIRPLASINVINSQRHC